MDFLKTILKQSIITYLNMNFHYWLCLTHNIQYHMYCNQWLNNQEYMCMIHHHHNIYYHMHYHLLLWILGCYIYKLKGVICLQDFLFNFICFCNTCACIFTIDGSRYIVTWVTNVTIISWIAFRTFTWSIVITAFVVTGSIIWFCWSKTVAYAS